MGYVAKPHGYKGALNAFITAEGFNYKKISKIFLELNESLVPFFLQKMEHKNGDKYIVSIEGLQSESDALRLVGKKIYISQQDVNQTQKNIFQNHDLIGFEVYNQENDPIGEIIDVFETAAHPLIQVLHLDRRVLIPLAPELILKIQHKLKKIQVHILSGVLDF